MRDAPMEADRTVYARGDDKEYIAARSWEALKMPEEIWRLKWYCARTAEKVYELRPTVRAIPCLGTRRFLQVVDFERP